MVDNEYRRPYYYDSGLAENETKNETIARLREERNTQYNLKISNNDNSKEATIEGIMKPMMFNSFLSSFAAVG